MKIWINGAMGKMGAELISYLKDNETIKITGVVSPSHSGQEVTAQNAMLTIAKDLESLSSGADFPDVIVDFSIAQTAQMIIDKRASEGIKTNDIPMHSLRLSGAIAHQQVHLSSQGEVLRIEHDANNRSCFMPGVVLSIEKVIEQNHVLYSIAPLLFDTKD